MRNHLYTCDANGNNMEPIAPVANISDARSSIIEQYNRYDDAKIVSERLDNVGGTIFEVESNNDCCERVTGYYCMTK